MICPWDMRDILRMSLLCLLNIFGKCVLCALDVHRIPQESSLCLNLEHLLNVLTGDLVDVSIKHPRKLCFRECQMLAILKILFECLQSTSLERLFGISLGRAYYSLWITMGCPRNSPGIQ